MPLSTNQKISAVSGAFRYRKQFKKLLIRRFWQKCKAWKLDFDGVSAVFNIDDFYSNFWFYGDQDVGQVYEPALTRLIIRSARKCSNFFDIGANLGYFSVVAGCANPELRIVALEMDETLAPIVKKNFKANNIDNAEVVSGAVGKGEGFVRYTPHPYSFLANAAGEETEYPELELSAAVLEIDSFLEQKDF